MAKSVSDQLKDAIKGSGMSLNAITRATGVATSTLSRFMAGKRSLSQAAFNAVAHELGLALVKQKARNQ